MTRQPPYWRSTEGWEPPEREPKAPRSGWQIAGITLAVCVAIGGLVMLALIIAFFSAMSQFGSNK